jgi:type II secretory pathway pseudopilin PulG
MCVCFMNTQKGQIWIETVIYTLIGLTILAIVLALATPQLQKIKERAVIQQTANVLRTIDERLASVVDSPGNVRIVGVQITQGRIDIDPLSNTISYVLDESRLELSEVGENISEGNILVRTDAVGSRFRISLTLNYSGTYNLDNGGSTNLLTLQAGTTPYKLRLENVGDSGFDDPVHIDLSVL